MNNFTIEGFSETTGATVVKTSLAALVLSAALMGPMPQTQSTSNFTTSTNIFKEFATPFASVVSEEIDSLLTSDDFENQITEFYSNLHMAQEPLGPEFERVLFDNLWDLYAEA